MNVAIEKVWDALTNSEIVKQYFFGTELGRPKPLRQNVSTYFRTSQIDPNAFVVMSSVKDTKGGMIKKNQ